MSYHLLGWSLQFLSRTILYLIEIQQAKQKNQLTSPIMQRIFTLTFKWCNCPISGPFKQNVRLEPLGKPSADVEEFEFARPRRWIDDQFFSVPYMYKYTWRQTKRNPTRHILSEVLPELLCHYSFLYQFARRIDTKLSLLMNAYPIGLVMMII